MPIPARSPLDPAGLGVALAAAVPGAGRVEVVGRTGSTSSDLVAAAAAEPSAWPDRSVLVADHQAAGRGRAGRTWVTPPGTALTASVLLRPAVPADRLGWIALLGGLAVVRALRDGGVDARVKWPNDVVVGAPTDGAVPGWGSWRKVAGVLADVVATPPGPAPGSAGAPGAVVLGIGVNVAQGADELPVDHATSLALLGCRVERTELLARILGALVELDDRWRDADGDAVAAGLADACAAACVTLGAAVRVERPGGDEVVGTAVGLAEDGALVLLDRAGRHHAVHAGDVRLRQ